MSTPPPPPRRSTRITRQSILASSLPKPAISHTSLPSHPRIARGLLDSMNVIELKEALRDHGLELTRSKADLHARLLKVQTFIADRDFALPKPTPGPLPSSLRTYLDDLFPLTMHARQLLCGPTSHICVKLHLAAMLRMAGAELEGLSRLLAAGILLSRSISASADTAAVMAPFLRALAAVPPAAAKDNPLQYLPEPDLAFNELQWSAAVLDRDNTKPIITETAWFPIASPFLPLPLNSTGAESPFRVTIFLLFGSLATQTCVPTLGPWLTG